MSADRPRRPPTEGIDRHASARSGAHLDAHAHALALLAGRAYSIEELRRRLARRAHPAADIDQAIERLAQVGLVDDQAFARQFARSRLVTRGAAPRRVRQELARRGVPRGIADAAVDEVLADEGVDLTASIEQLARRRAALLRGVDPRARRRRLYAYLARRGYDSDVVVRAVASVIGEPGRERGAVGRGETGEGRATD